MKHAALFVTGLIIGFLGETNGWPILLTLGTSLVAGVILSILLE